MGVLLNLFYPVFDNDANEIIIHESESCRYLIDHSDFPTFFKKFMLKFFNFLMGKRKRQL